MKTITNTIMKKKSLPRPRMYKQTQANRYGILRTEIGMDKQIQTTALTGNIPKTKTSIYIVKQRQIFTILKGPNSPTSPRDVKERQAKQQASNNSR